MDNEISTEGVCAVVRVFQVNQILQKLKLGWVHDLVCHMWQSHVEIGGYSVAYFDRIAAFEAPHHWTSVKGRAHMHLVYSLEIDASTKHVWALAFLEVQWYGTSNTAMWSKYAME